MNDHTPRVSVIIPTHNRLAILRKNLDALCGQLYPGTQWEVIVVADGCSDGTEEAIQGAVYPFTLRVFSQPASGAGSARNRGAEEASGELLIFLDDDVIPSSGLIRAHVQTHLQRPKGVVVGPYLLPREARSTLFGSMVREWWRKQFHTMAYPGYKFIYRDLLGGNFSLPAELFREVGGFDVTFRHAREDGELGARLIKAGISFAFAANAHAEHQETTSLARSLRRARHEGTADVKFARRHPDVGSALRFTREGGATLWLAYKAPWLGRFAAILAIPTLALLERVGMKKHWSRYYVRLFHYWYWRGVADELSTVGALHSFRATLTGPSADVGEGEGKADVQA